MMRITIFSIIIFLLSGCTGGKIETPALEDLAMAGVVGYDKIENDSNKIRLTVSTMQPSEEAKENIQIISAENEISYGAVLNVSEKIENDIIFSQLRVAIFGKELIEQHDFDRILKRLYRDPSVGSNVYIAIVDGKAEDLIRGDYPSKQNINFFLNDLLRPRYRNAFTPFTTIQDYIYSSTSETKDISIPFIKKEEKTVSIKGILVFDNKKIATKFDEQESKILQSLDPKINKVATMKINVDEKNQETKTKVALDFIEVKSDIKTNGDLNNPKANIKVAFNATLLEYLGKRDLSNAKEKEKLEKDINKELEKKAKKIMKKLQEANSDSLDIGEQFRKQKRGKWSKERWKSAYQRMDVSITYDTSIVATGSIE